MATQPDLSAASAFIWRTARLIDRYRFAYLFLDGEREAVLAALRPYQNLGGPHPAPLCATAGQFSQTALY